MTVTETLKNTVKGALGTSDEPRELYSVPRPPSFYTVLQHQRPRSYGANC